MFLTGFKEQEVFNIVSEHLTQHTEQEVFNIVSKHLKLLCEQNIVEKDDDIYKLTEKGIELLNTPTNS